MAVMALVVVMGLTGAEEFESDTIGLISCVTTTDKL